MDKRLLSIAVGALFAAGATSAPVLAAGQYGEKTGAQEQQQSGQMGASAGGHPQFSQVDKDGDKNISKAEAEEAGLNQLVQNWDQADRDQDDVLDDAEFSVFIEQQGGQMQQQEGGMGGQQPEGGMGGAQEQDQGAGGATER